MEGWKRYDGRKIFVVLKGGRKYQGEVLEVEIREDGTAFITIKDKFGDFVSFVSTEIELIQEEKK